MEANLKTPILENETRSDASADGFTSFPAMNQSLEQKTSTWAPASKPNSTLQSSTQPTISPEVLRNLEEQVEQAWAETKEEKRRVEAAEVRMASLQEEVDRSQLEVGAAVQEMHQTARACEMKLDRYKTRLDLQMELVNRSKKEVGAAIEETHQTAMACETKLDQFQVKLELQVELVAQYEEFLTNREEKLEKLSEELENQTKNVKMLKDELETQQNHKKDDADCLKASSTSVIAGTVDVPKIPPTPVTKEAADLGTSPVSLLPPHLTVGWHEVVGLILIVLILGVCSLLVGKCLGARKRQGKLRLDQQLVLPGSALNKPILKRVRTVGKKGNETLQELDVALSAAWDLLLDLSKSFGGSHWCTAMQACGRPLSAITSPCSVLVSAYLVADALV